ncbi:MAG: stage II sporulation protein D [Clostridia bacterium]|nr:stage II sporulation protein D [Clostridia bacterium]MBR2734968.1 stage II sporulation protein D [Clostridia bacterium]
MKVSKTLKWPIICMVILILIVLIPLLAVTKDNRRRSDTNYQKSSIRNCDADNQRCFCVRDESSGNIMNIPDREFLYGVVCTEMPAKFEDEALKAQAVASYTYFCRARNLERAKDGGSGYDFTVDTQKALNYITKEQRKEKWGSHFEEYEKKIENAVDSVFGEIIEDEGEPILAAYHAISSGKTEKSEDVFGGSVKYLTNVESSGDKAATGYETTAKIDTEKFKEILKSKFRDLKSDIPPEKWIGAPKRSEGGMVKEIDICGKIFKGTDIRSMFALRSSDFDLWFDKAENKFIFKVLGYGHGVGMSQYGAQNMALEGNDYKKILSWYYPGTSIEKISG